MSARQQAEGFLTKQGRRHADWASADGLRGIGWALLDLADAIREHKPKQVTGELVMRASGIPKPPDPPPPGRNPASGETEPPPARPLHRPR